jgi:mono/diheme cytochrome c family protein
MGLFVRRGDVGREAIMKGCCILAAVLLVAANGFGHADDLDAGKKLYVDNCLRCHGNKGQGGVGAKLAGDASYWESDIFKRAVLTGVDDEGKQLKKAMPRFGKVGLTKPNGAIPSDADLENVLAYLKTFGPKRGNH